MGDRYTVSQWKIFVKLLLVTRYYCAIIHGNKFVKSNHRSPTQLKTASINDEMNFALSLGIQRIFLFKKFVRRQNFEMALKFRCFSMHPIMHISSIFQWLMKAPNSSILMTMNPFLCRQNHFYSAKTTAPDQTQMFRQLLRS